MSVVKKCRGRGGVWLGLVSLSARLLAGVVVALAVVSLLPGASHIQVAAAPPPPAPVHAPCYDCEMYNVMQHDAPRTSKISSQCQYPCKCPNKEIRCKAGVNIVKDGCDCCYMCARPQGDLCDYKDKCDEEKGLYCDFSMDDGVRGVCRAKSALPCHVDGRAYKDGEEFKPACNQHCSCQNGLVSCSTACPQEERYPSSVHCKEPQLISIPNRCCKEWVCPNSNSMPEPPSEYSDDPRKATVDKPTACNTETTNWSACSVTCDMGVSIRITNNNEKCQPMQERRLCFVRPCDMDDTKKTKTKCKNTWKQPKGIKFTYNGCRSMKDYRPKYCSTCKKRRCCMPDKTETRVMEWVCPGDKIMEQPFMWIKSCTCTDECP